MLFLVCDANDGIYLRILCLKPTIEPERQLSPGIPQVFDVTAITAWYGHSVALSTSNDVFVACHVYIILLIDSVLVTWRVSNDRGDNINGVGNIDDVKTRRQYNTVVVAV